MKDESPDRGSAAGALSHLRVLDLSRVLAGPWASQTLGDLGAEVIKVERPGTGDDTRLWGPPFLKDEEGADTRDSAYYLCANRNKQSVAIDFTQPEGQALVRDLAKRCDVVIENFKVGGLAHYGLDFASLHAVNPRLVYCSITGFGQTGPYAERAGYDFLMQGMGGLMSITGRADGEEGAGPMKVGVALTDILTGLYASTAILAALQSRDLTGVGQHIDLALLDAQVAAISHVAMMYLVSGQQPPRLGTASPITCPWQSFGCSDGQIVVAVGNDSQFVQFCKVLGEPQWSGDERFATNPLRAKHRTTLVPMIEAVLATRSVGHWHSAFDAAGVPSGPINGFAEVFADPQIRHRGVLTHMAHPTAGNLPQVANPVQYSATPVTYQRPPPVLGQHTHEVLRDVLGLDDARIDELGRQRVIG